MVNCVGFMWKTKVCIGYKCIILNWLRGRSRVGFCIEGGLLYWWKIRMVRFLILLGFWLWMGRMFSCLLAWVWGSIWYIWNLMRIWLCLLFMVILSVFTRNSSHKYSSKTDKNTQISYKEHTWPTEDKTKETITTTI